ncbi:Inherit from opiNOG: protein Hydra magnipapillata [Seminavis robusta]|uniref:Inherit from opiNOG: protein Hydra magnipapillata n=1 Tax=Seminavis robusta TaxID=568900 RepID=A0A9N8DNR3_9STRA|nr:Inherit from opiNOG: protein Hydra magnipapillata [Seminavis robusta]|eukprot:Sro185_g080210.1 Inherit from opiNOG: protein Hydra magnipapillata (549) ;mRNA; f:10661-12307
MPRGHQGRMRRAKAFAKKLLRELKGDALPPPAEVNSRERNEAQDGVVQVQVEPPVASANENGPGSEDDEPTPALKKRKTYRRSERFSTRNRKKRDIWTDEFVGKPTLAELNEVITDENKAIQFLASKGVITIPTVCGRCNCQVTPDWKRHQSRCQKANCIWRAPAECEICPCKHVETVPVSTEDNGKQCQNQECGWTWSPGKPWTCSFFRKSFLSDCRLPKNDLVLLLYLWLTNATHSMVCSMLGWNSDTATRWLKWCRKMAQEIVVSQPHQNNMIGGNNIIVEIDESKFAKRKYHRGRRVKGSWVLGMVERTQQRRMVLLVVADRTRKTLEHAIMTFVHPGSTIHTDMWKGYLSLERLGYDHKTLCHKYEFVSAEGTHTQTIEGNWTPLKRAIPVQCRSGVDLQEYLFQFMWRRKNQGREWEALWEGLSRVRFTVNELEKMEQEREERCEDDDDEYLPMDDAEEAEKAEKEAVDDNDYEDFVTSFGDMDLTPVEDGGTMVTTVTNESTEETNERDDEDLAYEVIGEMLAGGAVDRSLFYHDLQTAII